MVGGELFLDAGDKLGIIVGGGGGYGSGANGYGGGGGGGSFVYGGSGLLFAAGGGGGAVFRSASGQPWNRNRLWRPSTGPVRASYGGGGGSAFPEN